MSRARSLLDENMPHAVREAVGRLEPAVDVRVMVGEDFSVAQLSEDLLLIWGASEAEKWRDRLVYLPLVSR